MNETSIRTHSSNLQSLLSQFAAQHHLFEAKHAAHNRQRELDVLETERLTQRVEALRREREPELASLLVLASSMQQERSRDKRTSQLELQCESLRLNVSNAQAEAESLRERLREAQISSTRANLFAQQLSEELTRAKADAAKAERRAIREAQRAAAVSEEKTAMERRTFALDRESRQLKSRLEDCRPQLPPPAKKKQRAAMPDVQDEFDFNF